MCSVELRRVNELVASLKGAPKSYFKPLLSGNFAEGVGYRTDKEGENGF